MAYDARHSETEEHRPERRYAGAVWGDGTPPV